ncbi:chitin deacetylase [Chytridiales sp. JEL 0842]|nr:chitin deacetylase [Chytridiales sp. JEL 0842]
MKLLVITSALAILAASASAQAPDFGALGYPSGQPVPIPPNLLGETFKVPQTPVVPSWTEAIKKLATRPIPNLPLADELGSPWGYDPSADFTTCPNGIWSLTIDDGPKDLTPQFLDLLRVNNTKATFYVLGANVVNKPQWSVNLKAAFDAGHQIALHSWTHRKLSNLTDDQIVSEFMWNALAVKQVIGRIPRYMRPPYGDTDDRVRGLLSGFGFKQVIWNVLLNDTVIPAGDLPSPDPNTWRIVNATNFLRDILRNGNAANGIAPFLPNTGGYISLHHELTPEHLTLANETLGLLSGRFQFRTSAYCVAGKEDLDEMYFRNDEPLAQFLNSIKLPLPADVVVKDPLTNQTVQTVPRKGSGALESVVGSWGYVYTMVIGLIVFGGLVGAL